MASIIDFNLPSLIKASHNMGHSGLTLFKNRNVCATFLGTPSSLSDLGYSLVVARVRAFFTGAQNHEERANMRYYKLNHPHSRPFVSPTGC
jgi:hypothetical protein